ncbi:hypothetical protein [Streptomyces sp. CB01580]|uniref:hypothetical protein n=1 Tax=Streptomyces sp. CB01580 TaxID=1703933 RepID=UPI00093DC5D9|nr:hypothetical protein [Streptomyces sp. CB01580]
MNRPLSSLRRFLTAFSLLSVVAAGLAFAALVHGALDGPRWLLLLGVPASALALVVFGKVGEPSRSDILVRGLRPGGPRAFAPALVHGVRAVDTRTGRLARDGQSLESVFAFDLTVVPDGLPAYRIQVRHPLDVQGLLHRPRGVVEYDPEQPWRVVIPDNPPREWLARANIVTPPAVVKQSVAASPAGLWTFVASAAFAAVLLVLVRVLG